MKLFLQFPSLSGIGKDLHRETMPFVRVWNEFMDNVIGIKRLNALFVQIPRKKGLPASNPPG